MHNRSLLDSVKLGKEDRPLPRKQKKNHRDRVFSSFWTIRLNNEMLCNDKEISPVDKRILSLYFTR